jgi:hypothetical protein
MLMLQASWTQAWYISMVNELREFRWVWRQGRREGSRILLLFIYLFIVTQD